MKRLVERSVPETAESRLFGAAALIMSVPQRVDLVDAIVVLPGQGEDRRLQKAVDLFDSHPNVRYLIVAGSYDGERTWFLPTVEQLQSRYGLRRTEGVVVHEMAKNTLVQACAVIEEVQNLGITSYALVAPPYHLPRAYMTHVYAMCDNWRPIIPVPTHMSPLEISPETGLTQADMIPGEAERILRYQELCGVISYSALLKYLEWLWQDSILSSSLNNRA